MPNAISTLVSALLSLGAAALALNELRGVILAGPVLYGIYQSGNSLIAVWLGFCTLGGIAISVAATTIAARKLRSIALA